MSCEIAPDKFGLMNGLRQPGQMYEIIAVEKIERTGE